MKKFAFPRDIENKKDMKIGYLIRTDGACDYYRAVLPITKVIQNTKAKAEEFSVRDRMSRLEQVFDQANLFVMPRLVELPYISLMEEIKKNGHKSVVDHDDNLFDVSPLSNHYEEFGTQDVKIKTADGKMLDLWEDGRNIDLKKNKKTLDNCKKAVELADMVTVTTPVLADVYRQFNDNIRILPNCIDPALWQRLPLQKHKGIRMGWYGGSSHFEDLVMVEKVIVEILEKYKDVTLVIMGQKFPGFIKKFPPHRLEFHNWVPTPAYHYKAAILDLDFAFIPLNDTKFNRSKSPIKWIEQAALQVPCVTSHIPPYSEVAEEGNGIFIKENDPDSWFKGMSMMIEDPLLRAAMGRQAKKTVDRFFNINTQYHRWYEAYKEA